MEKKKEVILQNAILENVFQYLLEKLRGISGITIERTTDDGTIFSYDIQYVYPSKANKIEVKYTTMIMPQGNIEKTYLQWDEFIAMSFEGLQLQTNTVLLKAECHQHFILSVFDNYWAGLLKDYGGINPEESKQKEGTIQVDAVKPEKKSIDETRPPSGKYDDLCRLWVNRPYTPYQNKEEFLSEHASELTPKTFERVLADAYKRGIIGKGKGKRGRYKPKTVSKLSLKSR